MNTKLLFVLIAISSFFLSTCATPVGPSGGPRDETGPEILFTEPETGTTNFSGSSLNIHFDEFVNRNSLNNNITIEPDFGAEFKTKWKKKRLTISFEDELPDSTTIIVTLGSQIADTRGNRIGAPTAIAFSTGDEIDEGQIKGRIRNAQTGAGQIATKVALFREPLNLNSPYNYVAETDTGGYFRFSYLREGLYKTFYFDDRNRDKIWDREFETAQPFAIEEILLEQADSVEIGELYIQQSDTLAPKLQAVGLFSNKRMRIRFNEDITTNDSTAIQIVDSLGVKYSDAIPLYIKPDEPYVLFAQSDSSLLESNFYTIEVDNLTDVAGNPVETSNVEFEGSSQADTTLQRVVSIETDIGLFPTQPFEAIYATDITNIMMVDSIVVVEGDVTFDDWPAIRVDRNILQIYPQEQWIEGIDYQFLIWNPATQRRALFTPEIWDNSEMGELEIAIQDSDTVFTSNYLYMLENEQNELTYSGSMEQVTVIENLPPLTYRLILFKDENGNGMWDQGSVDPYIKPEPKYIRQRVNVRTGFTAQITIEF